MFKIDSEDVNLHISYKDEDYAVMFNTTSKNRTELQSEQFKANKPDKNSKDDTIVTRNVPGKMEIFNKYENGFE